MNRFEKAARKLRAGGVGSPSVRAMWPGVGSPSIRPRYVRRGVGSPAVKVPAGADENAVLYSDPEYAAGDVTYLPFRSSTAIGIAGSATASQVIQVNTKRPFQPQDIRFPSVLEGLVLNKAEIQGTNMLANSTGMPLELLSEVTTIGPIDWITIDTASGMELTIENIGAEPNQIPRGALWGTALRR